MVLSGTDWQQGFQECGGGIMEGDMYLRIGGKILCESCVDELTEEA